MSSPSSTSPPVAAAPISTDLLCIACQYNLRTRTATDLCPECGLPVAQTIAHRRQHASAITHPRLFRLACYCLAIPSLVCWLYALLYWVLDHFVTRAPGPMVLAQYLLRDLAQIAFMVTLLVATLFFLNSLSTRVVSAAGRTLVTVLVIAYNFLSAIAVVVSFAMLPRGRPIRVLVGLAILRGQRIGVACICLLLALEGYFVLQRLAKALAHPRLAYWSRWALAAVIADSGVSLGVYLLLSVWRPTRDLQPFQGVLLGIDAVSAALFVGFGIFWLFVARVVPRHQAKPAAAPQPLPMPPPALSPQKKIDTFLASRKVTPAK